jgi:hypothetical protein
MVQYANAVVRKQSSKGPGVPGLLLSPVNDQKFILTVYSKGNYRRQSEDELYAGRMVPPSERPYLAADDCGTHSGRFPNVRFRE